MYFCVYHRISKNCIAVKIFTNPLHVLDRSIIHVNVSSECVSRSLVSLHGSIPSHWAPRAAAGGACLATAREGMMGLLDLKPPDAAELA